MKSISIIAKAKIENFIPNFSFILDGVIIIFMIDHNKWWNEQLSNIQSNLFKLDSRQRDNLWL